MALDIPFPAHDASLVPVPRQPGLAHVRLSEFLDLTPPFRLQMCLRPYRLPWLSSPHRTQPLW